MYFVLIMSKKSNLFKNAQTKDVCIHIFFYKKGNIMHNMVLLITKPLKLFLNIPHVFLKGILKDDAHWNKD